MLYILFAIPAGPRTAYLWVAWSAPNFLGRLRDGGELGDLVLDRYRVADDGGGEPALRAEAESLEVHVFGRLVDPARQLFDRLAPCRLRGDEAEDGHLVLGDVTERLKRSRAL